ncbi:ankyrin repeat-containing protein [Cryptosporidium canis]|uniref:Ankyrin repeat-containing protein n=1 Tax=Cryptosporidium canis TaxID=195482 RepID=A0A9D5DJX1_9CRYT|nr:ankyrin repeat-containing protein [Cryptosporidium canis]
MQFYIHLISVLLLTILVCCESKSIFPVGCPLNSVSDSLLNITPRSNCECEKKGPEGDDCIDVVDEFHEKIRLQDLEAIKSMLSKLCVDNLNSVSNSTGETALLISSGQNGYISYTISLYLIEHGADPNKVGPNGITPLINAIQRSNFPLVALLLLSGANIDCSDNRDLSPLFHSVISRNLKMAHFLLLCGSNPNIPDRKGLTPFYYLLKDGMSANTEEFLELFLDYGASITDLTLDGKDAISFMIESGNKKLLNRLIDHSTFSKYIIRNNIEDEYIAGNERLYSNSTLAEINRKLANAKDKILRIITAIKRGFDRRVIFSLLIPELKVNNKDICIVRDSEGRNLLWWLTHLGDEQLIRLLVDFYKIQTNSGILDFELCEIHEPDIYGNLPVAHLIYNINYEHELALKGVRDEKKEQLPFYRHSTFGNRRSFKFFEELEESKGINISRSNEHRLEKFQILQEMLMFQNPKTNTTLWYELAMSSSNNINGEQKIVEYLSSSAIDFYVSSFVVRCFCKPLKRHSIPTPRSIPIIGTLEYDNSISILSLLLLLNKNYTSKVVLQSVLREAMLQSFWCIHALQHALITATILGKDDIIRNILLGRVQTLSEVLSSLDYSSELSIKVASRLLGSLPPEFPNLDDLMAIPITLLVRFIILSNSIEGAGSNIKPSSEVDLDEMDNLVKIDNIEHNKIFQYINESKDMSSEFQTREENKSERPPNNTCESQMSGNCTMRSSIEPVPVVGRELFLQYQFDFSDSVRGGDQEVEFDEQNELEEQMKFVKSEIRRGYFEDDDQLSQQVTSGDYESIFSNFDTVFSQRSKLFHNFTEKIDEGIAQSTKKKEGAPRVDPIGGALNLLKQLLSPEMTKFVRSSSFEYIISLLQNSTCNYPRNNEVELFLERNRDLSKLDGIRGFGSRFDGLDLQDTDLNAPNSQVDDKIKGILDDFDCFGQDDMELISPCDDLEVNSLFRRLDKSSDENSYLGNCLIELPNICNLMITKEVLWVPMILNQDRNHDLDPSSTLLLDSQCMNDESKCFIPTLNSEFQKIHLGYIPEIPSRVNVTDLGPLIGRGEFCGMLQKHSICEQSSYYTTFEDLLAKKAKIITLLNTSPHQHIIPSAIWVSSAILLTSLIYLLLWATISYFKVLYIKNMINEWSRDKIKKVSSIRKAKRRQIKGVKRDKKKEISERSDESKDFTPTSSSTIHTLTKSILKFIRRVLMNTLPYSVFRLRDFAEVFPASGSRKVLDSLLMALSLIFISPWFVYKDNFSLKENLKDKRSQNTLKITKSNLLNAPINYFKQINSQKSTNFQSLINYLFFFLQIISLIYLFTILFLISEYDYIWFLTGVIITATLCSSVRIYYTHDFVSDYCNKYFCGFSKDYYLYNYYYYKKSMKNRKNIRNIYSNLLNCAMNSSTLIRNNCLRQYDRNDEYDYGFDCTEAHPITNKIDITSSNDEIPNSYHQSEPSHSLAFSKNSSSKNNPQINQIPECHSKSGESIHDSFNNDNDVDNIIQLDEGSNSSILSNVGSSLSNMSSPNMTRLNMLDISSSDMTALDSKTYSPLGSSSSYSSVSLERSLVDDESLSSDISPGGSEFPDSDSYSEALDKREASSGLIQVIPESHNYNTEESNVDVKKSYERGDFVDFPDLLSINSSISTDGKSHERGITIPWSRSPNPSLRYYSSKLDAAAGLNSSKSSSMDFPESYIGVITDKYYKTLNGPAIKVNSNNLATKSLKSVLSNYSSRFKSPFKSGQSKDVTICNKANIFINYKKQKRISSINNNFSFILRNHNQIKRPIRLGKFKRIISSADDTLSCDNIRTNIGNVVTNNQIHKPLYRMVDEVSYNSPYEYFSVVVTCKIISCMIAMSSNISVTFFKSNSYLIRDSTLYFLYNRSPLTVYVIECIFTFWISNLIFEIMKGLIILLFFVKQRKRLCSILVQHIPIQFKYSNVQEFIQIVSYWRSAIQHILYKNTKLWTSFLNASVSINTLIMLGIGKIMLFTIYNKKNRIYNNLPLDISASGLMSKISSSNQDMSTSLSSSDFEMNDSDFIGREISKILSSSEVGEGISANLLNELDSGLMGDHHSYYKSRPISTNSHHHFIDSISNIDDILNSNTKDTYMINQYNDLSSASDINGNSYGGGEDRKDKSGIMSAGNNNNILRSIGSGIGDQIYSSPVLPYSNLMSISNMRASGISNILTIPQYTASYMVHEGLTPTPFTENVINTYSNCETVFLTMGIVMLIFSSYVIRLLYQINRSSVRTHSWLQNILHRTPPGAGIYIVIEKVLLVINSTPPVLKICGFDITEKFSGFCLYIFTPIVILVFFKFTT